MKHFLICLALVVVPLTSVAQTPPGPPPSSPRPPPGPPSSTSTEKIWSRINISSIKPTLSARNVYILKGMHNNGVRGGWTVETRYQIDDATKVVQITIAAHAPKGSVTTRNLDPVEAKVEIKELTGPAYSGKPGRFDVIVVGHDGKELARTTYDIPAK